MIRLKQIISRFNVVVADYGDSNDCRLLLYECRCKKGEIEAGPLQERSEPDKFRDTVPVLLYIGGYGVISKPAGQAEQIVADKERFISSHQEDGSVCFVRKSQVVPLLDKLEKTLLHVECVNNGADILTRGKEYYASAVSWKNLAHPDPMGARLSAQLYKKAKLFVLVVVLGMLSVNFAVRGTIDKKYAEGHALLGALQNEKGRQNELSKQEQDMMKEFAVGISSGFALLGDRIGAALPDPVILRNLAIQPPVKRLEEGKPLKVEASKVVVKGESANAAGISLFATRLKGIDGVRDLKISSVEQNRDGQSLNFVIEMEL